MISVAVKGGGLIRRAGSLAHPYSSPPLHYLTDAVAHPDTVMVLRAIVETTYTGYSDDIHPL